MIWWEVITGEAGSPLPDNRESLLIQSRISACAAVLCLLTSIACGIGMMARERRPPVSSVISLPLLVPVFFLWWSTITTNAF